MRRRTALLLPPLVLLPPVAALSACTDGGGSGGGSSDGGANGSGGSDGGSGSDGGAASDGGSASSSPSSPTPTADPAEQRAQDLTIEQAAAQLVLAGIPAGTSPKRSLTAELGIGGFFLLGTWDSAAAVRSVVEGVDDEVAEDGVAPLLCVDQEGGQIRMLRGDAARRTPSAADLGAEGTDAVTAAYRSIGEDLHALGLHAALAPVADTVDPELGRANAPVGKIDRGFGTDPDTVADCVVAAVEALDGQDTASALKHFPGLGRVRGNTDFSATGITDETTDADDPFLEPFRAGIEAGADMVMLSSALYPRMDPGSPAMFSSAIVTDVLRGRLGFDGLVVSDDVGSAAAVQDVPLGERATRLLEAGGDVVLTADPSLAGDLVDAIAAWAQDSEKAERRVRESAARMLRVKRSRGVDGV
ncbi:glycoside hydrolase family 3 N-terminal domain-containing protein [Brachybacterium sp. ACRRE]|uniref:glycoside hydrolase family 3 N-terminal domain-containing protein n=1 Tax=Brachybacterium sp. ACRRE TaxID=2918184 RepID=UPI001EF25BB9|nr:glycoside hydrolase family 3 N-terminal domain-containing protein [Brachybacterium sp. ACRRE]MCG7311497.1 glycoside hydrolase family 3 protein [Brachybacterium sp. ACRRE]